MQPAHSIRDTLDRLTRLTGQSETELLAEALEHGLREIFRNKIIDGYLEGTVTREEALVQLGEPLLLDVEYRRDSLTRDVQWGFGRV